MPEISIDRRSPAVTAQFSPVKIACCDDDKVTVPSVVALPSTPETGVYRLTVSVTEPEGLADSTTVLIDPVDITGLPGGIRAVTVVPWPSQFADHRS